jgi:hypothetical protein
VTGTDHTDALIATLRQPALPAERAGEAAAVASMVGARAGAAAPRGIRPRRGVAIVAITAASLGVGGLAAAGPGVFPKVLDFGTPESDVPEPEPVELPDAVFDAPTNPAAPLVVPGGDGAAQPAVPNESPATPAAPDRSEAAANRSDTGSSRCAEDDHGEAVSDAAMVGDAGAIDEIARPACVETADTELTGPPTGVEPGPPVDPATPSAPEAPIGRPSEPGPPVPPAEPAATPSAEAPIAPQPDDTPDQSGPPGPPDAPNRSDTSGGPGTPVEPETIVPPAPPVEPGPKADAAVRDDNGDPATGDGNGPGRP